MGKLFAEIKAYYPGKYLFPRLTASKELQKQADQLKQHNITLKNLPAWKGHNRDEIREFSSEIIKLADLHLDKENGQKLIIIKGVDTPAQTVLKAVESTFLLLQGGSYLPFPSEKIYWPVIDLHFHEENELPMCVVRKGSIFFNNSHPDVPLPLEYQNVKDNGYERVSKILKREVYDKQTRKDDKAYKKDLNQYMGMHKGHVYDMLDSYFQIGPIYYDDKFRFTSDDVQKQKGLLRLFDEKVYWKRRRDNIEFLKNLQQAVPEKLATGTMSCHDMGKFRLGDGMFHAAAGAEFLKDADYIQELFKMDRITWLIMKNSVLHHMCFSGIGLGEYSLMSIYDMFDNPEMKEIITAGKVNLFIDNLTLLTACDIAGQTAFIPLNRKIEDLADLNKYLHNIFDKAAHRIGSSDMYYMEPNDWKYLYVHLNKLTYEMSSTRICNYLAGQDSNLDVNTNGGYSFYLDMLNAALEEMKVSSDAQKALVNFFAMLKSFPYSGKPLHSILCDNLGGNMQINKNAIRFLLQLSSQFFEYFSSTIETKLKKEGVFHITAGLYGENGKPIHTQENYEGYIENFKKLINDRESPYVDFVVSAKTIDKKIEVNIDIPASYKSKKDENK